MKPIVIISILFALVVCDNVSSQTTNKLSIPALLDTSEQASPTNITINHGQHEFYPGIKSQTLGFNGDYLGPTIRLHRGTTAHIKFINEMAEDTTIHGHGLHIPGYIDGGPQRKIKADDEWDLIIPITQQASTSWYHPHLMGKTAEHVHDGLAGLYVIEDKNSLSMDLPRDYGVNDIPLVVQERTFINGKMKPYQVTMEQIMTGLREETVIINGTVNPSISLPSGWVRFRLLNGSNARNYRFYFKGDRSFFKIATDGGYLEQPVTINSLLMAPGERNEIMLNLSKGEQLSLMAKLLPEENSTTAEWFVPKQTILAISTNDSVSKATLPKRLNTINYYEKS